MARGDLVTEMKWLRVIKNEVYKDSCNFGYVGAVLIVTLLAFTATAFTDNVNGRVYTVLEAIFCFDIQTKKITYELSWGSVFGKGLSGYITMFIPIVTAFPTMVAFGASQNSGYARFEISRYESVRYWVCRFVSATICAGICVTFGILLYAIALLPFFPQINDDMFSTGMDAALKGVLFKPWYAIVANMIFTSFVYGCVSVIPALLLSSFCRNPYIITCIPFVLSYSWGNIINKWIVAAYTDLNERLAENLSLLLPDASRQIYLPDGISSNELHIIMLQTAVIFTGLLIYIVIMRKKADCGK